jgi:hypothetical protein
MARLFPFEREAEMTSSLGMVNGVAYGYDLWRHAGFLAGQLQLDVPNRGGGLSCGWVWVTTRIAWWRDGR